MNKIFLLVVICIFLSCQDNKIDKIDLDLSKKTNKLKYSEILDSIRYIQLETQEYCLIGNVNQIIKEDTLLFIMDQKQKSIFIYNESGKFIQKINHIGKGEGEYISLTSFCIEPRKKKVFIYDEIQKKLLRYNYNGKYEKNLKLDDSEIIRSIGLLKNGNFIFFTPDLISRGRDGVWEVDTFGHFVKEYKDVKPKNKLVFVPYPYYSNCEQKISYYDYFTDELYSLNNNELLCEYSFDLKQKIPEKYLNKEGGVNNEGTDVYFVNYHIAETKDYYYLQFFSNKQGRVEVFFEKYTKKLIMADSLVNDIDSNKTPTKIFTFNKSSFAGVVWAKDAKLNPLLQLLFLKKKIR